MSEVHWNLVHSSTCVIGQIGHPGEPNHGTSSISKMLKFECLNTVNSGNVLNSNLYCEVVKHIYPCFLRIIASKKMQYCAAVFKIKCVTAISKVLRNTEMCLYSVFLVKCTAVTNTCNYIVSVTATVHSKNILNTAE